MSRPTFRPAALLACATLVSALALSVASAAQQPAPAAPTYDVVFDVNGAIYAGTTTFVVDKAGKVTGTMKLSEPALVDATLNGDVKDGVWTFNYAFTMDNQGQACGGTVSGSAKVSADQAEAAGTVAIGGDCSPDALNGTFSFKKRQK